MNWSSKIIRSVALVADFHFGSRVALFPPEFKDEDGIRYKPRRGQVELYNDYLDFCKKCDEFDVDTVILDGDAIHGLNKMEYGAGLMFSDMNIQKKLAAKVLEHLVKKRKFHVLSGSPYHESKDHHVHEYIAEQLNGKFHHMIANFQLTPTKRIMNVAHGTGGAAIYATMVLNREGDFVLQAEALKYLPFHTDIMVRAHLHKWIHVHLAKMHLIQLPCWMAWEPNKIYVKYYGKKQPDIGGVILLLDEQHRQIVFPFLYPLPHIADMVKKI